MLQINVLGGLYVTAEGRPLAGAAGQPRRLAILALLASAGERGVTRDAFLSYLWPDNDEERGRRALTQALYALRRDLGSDEVFLGLKDLRLNPDYITSDLARFHEAVQGDAPERAAELYRGPFLHGFALPGADTFGRWMEDERDALQHRYAEVLEAAARRALARQDPAAAVGYLKKRAALDPLNAQVAVKLMEALVAQGDVAAALQHARVHEILVMQELELRPDREVMALAERLRSSAQAGPPTATAGSAVEPAPPAEVTASLPVDPVEVKPLHRTSDVEFSQGVIEESPAAVSIPPVPSHSDEMLAAIRATSGWATITEEEVPPTPIWVRAPQPAHSRRRWLAAALLPLGLLVGWLIWYHRPPRATGVEGQPVVAVGHLVDYSETHGNDLGHPLADMLATNLARGSGFRVVSSARMLELMALMPGDTASRIGAAARQAGATELIDGSLYTLAPSVYRLDLRRVDLATGELVRAYRVEGRDLFSLADSGTAQLVADLGGRAPQGSISSVSTTSVEAYRFYEEGLRAFFGGDRERAAGLFQQALEHDPGFAMAQYYYAGTTDEDGEIYVRTRRAVELAPHASDRERLLITANWLLINSSPRLQAVADTLTVRYPDEPEGYLLLGSAAGMAGDYIGAIDPLLQVIRRDSLGLRGDALRCLACKALGGLIWNYQQMDSIPATDRLSSLWTRLRPQSAEAWRTRANVLAGIGRVEDAEQALRTADSLDPGSPGAINGHVWVLLRREAYDDVVNIAQASLATGGKARRADALWNLGVVLRQQGRLREALRLVMDERRQLGHEASLSFALLQGQILMEAGRLNEAIALFDTTARIRLSVEDSSQRARNAVWGFTHQADAYAAAGRASPLAGLADTVRVLGLLSGLGRDRLLHHHIRGLALRLKGDYAGAADAFREAMYAPIGFTRTNYELAGVLLKLKEPEEAITLLQQALRGAFDGTNLYITHTELHERLAEAFEVAGKPDSALANYRAVIRAWEKADPQFWARRQSAVRATLRLQSPTGP